MQTRSKSKMATYKINGEEKTAEQAIQYLLAHNNPPPTTHRDLQLISSLPFFDGTENANIEEFFTQLDHSARLSNWSAPDLLEILNLKMTGAAKIFLTTLKSTQQTTHPGTPLTYALAKEELVKRFKKESTPIKLLQQITTLDQSPSESIEDFADRIRHICSALMLKSQENPMGVLHNLINRLATDAFIKRLPQPTRSQVQLKLPSTLEEAQSYALAIKNISPQIQEIPVFAVQQQTTTPTPKATQPKATPPSPCKFCHGNHWQSDCQNKNKNKRTINTNTPNSPCKYCGAMHWQSDCRHKNKSTPPNNNRFTQSYQPRNKFTPRRQNFRPHWRHNNFTKPQHTTLQQRPTHTNTHFPITYHPYTPPICQLCDQQGHIAKICQQTKNLNTAGT